MAEDCLTVYSKEGINFAQLSDYHLGWSKIPAPMTWSNLKTYVYPYLNDELDIFFIPGDFFDTLIDLDSPYGQLAMIIIDEITELAREHKFLIRVLRGTFSHDRHQCQHFTTFTEGAKLGNDLLCRVVDNLEIEFIKDLDCTVLYCPDDLHYDDVFPVILELLEEHHLTQVDFMVNHGYWEHLLPEGIPHRPKNTLDEKIMSKYVKGVILNGHLHTPSVFGKCINPGSFERGTHNEEEPKGFFIGNYTDGKIRYEFVENKGALEFKSFWIDEYKYSDEGIEEFKRWVDELFKGKDHVHHHVRLITDFPTLKTVCAKYVHENYKGLHFDHRRTTKVKVDESTINTTITDLPVITEENLPAMILEDLNKRGITDISIEDIISELE